MKRPRADVSDLHLRGVSSCALARILKFARERPDVIADLPASESGIRHAHAEEAMAPLRGLVEDLQMPDCAVSIPILDFQRTVDYLVQSSSDWRDCMEAWARSDSPAAPVRCVLYHDEVTAGNPLRVQNRRRFVAVYLSFADWRHCLQHEHLWVPLTCVRSETLKTIPGHVASDPGGRASASQRRIYLRPSVWPSAVRELCRG